MFDEASQEKRYELDELDEFENISEVHSQFENSTDNYNLN